MSENAAYTYAMCEDIHLYEDLSEYGLYYNCKEEDMRKRGNDRDEYYVNDDPPSGDVAAIGEDETNELRREGTLSEERVEEEGEEEQEEEEESEENEEEEAVEESREADKFEGNSYLEVF